MKYRVVTTPDFWAALEADLPGGSSPSWHQFASYDLGDIIQVFGNGWDDLARLHPERADYRVHIGAGRIGSWAVKGQWARKRAEIELVAITVELWPLADDEGF